MRSNSQVIENKKRVGTNINGDPVYQLTDNNNQLIKDIYEMLVPETRPEYSIFVTRHSHFLWQDKLGDWWFFISEQDMFQAECAKPVIYLYPQKDTPVSVKVGAKITQSEPLYPQNGWQVLAHPNGQLDYQGKTYPNLFWEGTGFGQYNPHFGEGFVVSQSQVIPTIYSHLTSLGLNSQESFDFMEFWLPRLPQTPYIRLTWLDTSDMNQLAPLSVLPPPKTSIRIFLDFSGLETPVNLIPQNLSAPPRSGFTLVEWGGLLMK